MSIAQIRAELLKQLEHADERLLKMIYALVEAYDDSDESVIGFDAHGTPKTAEEMKEELTKEFLEAKEGKFISLSQLKTRSEKWLQDTK